MIIIQVEGPYFKNKLAELPKLAIGLTLWNYHTENQTDFFFHIETIELKGGGGMVVGYA